MPAEREHSIGYGNFTRVMDTLEVAVSASPYLAGDRFTAADVYLGAQIGWGLQFGSVPPHDALAEYWSRLESRPAWKRAEEIDDAAGAKMGMPPAGS